MQIKIQQFEGPLDLLLQLIEEQKLDITQISLANITEQFLEHLRSLTELKPQELADWLVVAAKLLVIKSRSLIPLLDLEEDEEDTGVDLTWQLYQYKRYKEAAKYLKTLDDQRLQGWTGNTNVIQLISFYPDPSVNPATLQQTMKYLAAALKEIAKVPEKVLEEVVTISEKIDQLQKLLAEKIEMRLQDLIKGSTSKTEVIVTFLALLELVKQKILTVDQEAMFSDIIIKKSK